MIIHEVSQNTPEWLKVRASKPTSSKFSCLITGSGLPSKSLSDYAMELATEAYLGAPIDDGFNGNKYTERGHELEPEARADYEMLKQTKVQEVGFMTDDLLRWGSSSDGLVGENGLVEFKNLISKTFMKLLVYVKKHNKTPPEYIPQLQGELFVSERKWVDIVFYNPNFDTIIHRHYPNLEYHATLKKQLMLCIAERNNILKLAKS